MRAWMGAEVGVLEAFGRQVRVDLRRGEIGVTEHLLQRAQVTPSREQMRREGVTQRVRAHALREPRGACVTLDDLVETLTRETRATVVDEQARLHFHADKWRTPAPAVKIERLHRSASHRHDPFL